MKSNIQYLIFGYLSQCFDDYGILPHEDDIYERFKVHFDNGVPFEIVEEEVNAFVRIHDLTDIKIKWEGELVGCNSRRIEEKSKLSPKAAGR